MKKYFGILTLLVSIFLMSCASIPSSKVTFDVDVQYESETPMVSVEVKPFWSTNIINGSGIGGFTCTFTNNTDKVAKVVWAESSVNYNGSSYVPFLDGQKYIQAQEPMSPTAIAKGGTLSKNVYSSAQPDFMSGKYGGWRMMPMAQDKVQLVLMVKGDNREEYITVECIANIAE